MSYFVVVNHRANVPMTVDELNKRGVGGRFVMQFIPIKPSLTQIVFRFDDWSSYLWWCGKTGRMPVTLNEFDGALHLSHDEYQQSKRVK